MKGESLYEVWREALDKAPGVKPMPCSFKNLLPTEKTAWNELAKFIQDLLLRGTS